MRHLLLRGVVAGSLATTCALGGALSPVSAASRSATPSLPLTVTPLAPTTASPAGATATDPPDYAATAVAGAQAQATATATAIPATVAPVATASATAIGTNTAAAADASTPVPTTTGAGTTTSPATVTASEIIATAQQYIGYPYAYIGDTPATGFSCIGFAHFVFAQNGIYIPEELGQAYASAPHVDQDSLQPGDLVFFQNTAWQGISHVAIYIGAGKMIAADSFQTGVELDTLSDSYWQEHYFGATRPLANPGGAPIAPVATTVPSGPSLVPPGGASLAIKVGAPLFARHMTTVYSGPDTTYTTIDTVTPHVRLTSVQTQGQWVNVSYDAANQYGWVYGPDLYLPANAAGNSSRSASGQDTTGTGQGHAGTGQKHATSQPRTRLVRRVSGIQRTARAKARRPVTTRHSTTTTHQKGAMLVVTADILFVRAGPSTHTRILRRVFRGDHVRLLARHKAWDYIQQRSGVRGWVYERWVRPA